MSKKTPQQILPLPLTGAEHRAMALLRHIAGAETAGHWCYDELAPYIAAARNIVRSKNAFDGGTDTLAVEGYVLKSARFTDRGSNETEKDKAFSRAIATIIEGNEGTSVTADAWDLFSFVNSAISEAQLYGAALMFELLTGGGR